jgi:hypothetical protein
VFWRIKYMLRLKPVMAGSLEAVRMDSPGYPEEMTDELNL